MAGKILVTGNSVRPELLQPLTEAGYKVENPTDLLSEQDLAAALEDADAYLFGGDEYASGTAIAKAKDLKVVAFLGVGYESFMDATAITSRGVRITNTPGTLTDSVAEFTIAQLLAARRQLVNYANRYRRGERGFEVKQTDVRGHPIGIVGLGAIGTRIAEILAVGLRAEVKYFSRTRKPRVEQALTLEYMELSDLASQVEALIIMVPGNETTHGLIDHSVLSRCNPGTLLVNTARPDIVDRQALDQALEDDLVSVAAFDGFYEEGEGDSLISKYSDDRLIVTGHIASLTSDARDGMAIKAVGSILNILQSGTDQYIVNG